MKNVRQEKLLQTVNAFHPLSVCRGNHLILVYVSELHTKISSVRRHSMICIIW
mgnify:CR=1 FL=1